MKDYDLLVFIGRFQPIHNAHLDIIEHALELAKDVVIVVGSAEQPRTVKNPWTASERKGLIQSALWDRRIDKYHPHVHIEYNVDSPYNDEAWVNRIQQIVAKHTKTPAARWVDGMPVEPELFKIGIIGHKKSGDSSTFYLDYFPQWDFVDYGIDRQVERLDASFIRDHYFDPEANITFLKGVVPNSVYSFLDHWRNTEEYRTIVGEKEFIDKYKRQYESFPYPPVFVTTDAVVIQSGHVLMVERGAHPGKGLMALPGGFLDAANDRSIEDCMLRELKEETGIKVPIPALRGNVQEVKVFDAINRSARGRTVTHAFKIVLPAGQLPKVKGSDDAAKAMWIPFSEIKPTNCFEDHYTIITHFMGIE